MSKPHKREFVIWHKQIAKVKARKFNPPVVGREISLEEKNRPLLQKLAEGLNKK
jgi:hypothetical protein